MQETCKPIARFLMWNPTTSLLQESERKLLRSSSNFLDSISGFSFAQTLQTDGFTNNICKATESIEDEAFQKRRVTHAFPHVPAA